MKQKIDICKAARLNKVVNNLQYFFIYAILYTYILINIDTSKLELFLNKILPKKFLTYYIKSVNLLKKSGKIYIIILFLLLSYSIYLSNYCINFFMRILMLFVNIINPKKVNKIKCSACIIYIL